MSLTLRERVQITRDDVLRRDLTNVQIKAGTGGCAVSSGDLADPYTGLQVHYVRGGASEVDIDHVVAEADAWRTGAAGWTVTRRTAVANDPLNLLAVGASVNRGKGDADAAEWLPPNTGFRCAYVARQVAVKARYTLWVTPAEKSAMGQVLATCPAQPLPAGGAPPAPAPASAAAQAPPAPAPTAAAGLDPRFPTCTAAKAAGYGPYVRGVDPEYAWYVDRNGDGTVC